MRAPQGCGTSYDFKFSVLAYMKQSPNTSLLPWLLVAWQHRKPLLKAMGIGLLLGLFIALSIPQEYEVVVATAAESIAIPDDEGLEGLDLSNNLGRAKRYDALKPSIYPEIFSSTSFLITLFDLPVQTTDCPPDSTLTLRDYLEKHLRRPWWEYPASVVSDLVTPPASPFAEGLPVLSAKDADIVDLLRERITIIPNRERRVTTFTCRMQDPLVAATVLDSLSRRIQAYITEYRTRKEREELASAKRLQEEARKSYYRAQEVQAAFEDRNRDLSLTNARKELVKLRVKTNFAREEYVRATLLVHAAEVQVVRVRPVFAVIEPATTPVRPSSPSKMKYMAAFALLGVVVGYARIGFFKIKKRK